MDWIAYTLLILQMYLLSSNSKWLSQYIVPDKLGFLCGFLGSCFLMVFSTTVGSPFMFIFNLILCGFNFKGYIK